MVGTKVTEKAGYSPVSQRESTERKDADFFRSEIKKHNLNHMEIIYEKGEISMARKSNKINIILHEPADEQTRKNVQQAFDDLYIKIVVDKLSASGLTYDEQKAALERISAAASK